MDTTLVVTEGRVARPTCVVPTATISAVVYPVYGVLAQGCNATTSYRCGAVRCSCVVQAACRQLCGAGHSQEGLAGWLGWRARHP